MIRPSRRDAVWVADITYVDTDEGWLYVAGVLDRHTRRCVGLGHGRDAGHEPAPGDAGHGAHASAALPPDWFITPIEGSNTPAPPIGRGWLQPECSRA